jgi:tripartite-type tricarboxylate transporter receptor subunit TctC
MRRRDFLLLGLGTVGGAFAPAAHAQEKYPNRPIRLIVPSVPGGVHDVIGRVWAERVKSPLGTVVIDNRGGGGGAIAATAVAQSAPDGYTLLLGSTSTHALVPQGMANPPYDPVKDFVSIAVVAFSSTSIVVHPSLPVRTLAEFIAYAKANPGKLSYGSAGNGSITNMAGELLKKLAGNLDIIHIPYKGIGQGISDIMGGQIPVFSANATAQILDLHRAGKIRIISTNSAERIKAAPDIPTSIESGLPGMMAQTTFGIFAPAGTLPRIVEQLGQVTQQVMMEESLQRELLKLGFEPVLGVGGDKAAALFREEFDLWRSIVKTVHVQTQP